MNLYIAHVPSKLSFGPHIRVTSMSRLHALALIILLLCVSMWVALVHAKPSSWFACLSLIQVEATICLYAHTRCCCAYRLHHILDPCPWPAYFSKGHYHPLLMSEAHTSSCCLYGTVSHSFLLLVQQWVVALCPWLLIYAWGITPSCVASYIVSWVGFVAVASPCYIQATCHGIVPMALQAAFHKALRLFATIGRGVCITPRAIVATGCIPPHVMEPICRCQQGSSPMCLARVRGLTLWCGHA